MNDTFLRNLETINFQMIKYYQNDNEFGNKILKSLEIIYCINNEIYSNERILKICATLNMLFKDNSGKDIDSNWIASQLNQLFNYYNIKIKEKIPKELMDEEMLKTKYTTLFIDNYKKIRNNFMHGIIDLYQEFTVINTTDYLFYIISLYELLNILITFPNFNSLTTTDEFITKIKNNNKHYKNNKTVPPISSDA